MRTANTLSDWADTQTDLSLRWPHGSFCWFCHEAAYICLLYYVKGPVARTTKQFKDGSIASWNIFMIEVGLIK